MGAEVVAAAAQGAKFKRARLGIRCDVAEIRIDDSRSVLALPRTFMNECGQAVAPLVRYERATGDRLMVVHDDIDLPFGKLRVQYGGGAGGHNGIRSVVGSLSTGDFWRLKVGVGRPPGRVDPADYVLGRFAKAERSTIRSRMMGNAAERHGSRTMVSPSLNFRMCSWHVAVPD